MMVVIGSNEENLIKASNLLIENRLSNQVLSSSVLVNKETNIKINREQKLNLGHLTLKDLGYSDFLLEGAFNQQALFDVKIPTGKVLDDGSKIVLNLRYSDNLHFEKSLVTVSINDVLVGSKKLDRQHSNNDKLELKIPKDIDNKNYYQVKLVFNLNIKIRIVLLERVIILGHMYQIVLIWRYLQKKMKLYLLKVIRIHLLEMMSLMI